MNTPDKCPKCCQPLLLYDCHGGPGTNQEACGACVSCLHRVIEEKDCENAALKERIKRLEDEAESARRMGWIEAAGLCGKLAITTCGEDHAADILRGVVTWDELVEHADKLDVEALATSRWLVGKLQAKEAKP